MILHVIRRELAARWLLLPAAIVIGAFAMIAIHSIGHVRGDADGIMNGTWVGTLVVSTIVGMSLLGDELTNSRLSFYFARPFSPHAIFGGKLAAGVLVALLIQIAIVILVALALPELSWRGSVLAKRDVLSVGGERVLATIGCILLGMAASIALGSKTRWFVVDGLCITIVGVIGTWFALQLEPDPAWLPAEAIRGTGEKALLHAAALAVVVAGLGVATARALVLGRTDRMRAHRTLSTTLWPIVVPAIVLVAFIGEQTTPLIPDPPVLPRGVLDAPTVEPATAVSGEDVPVPYLLVVDETGAVRLGAAASWAELDANRVRLAKKSVPITPDPDPPWTESLVARFLQARRIEGTTGDLAVSSIWMFDDMREREAQSRRLVQKALIASQNQYVERRSATKRQVSDLAYAAGVAGLVVDRDGPGFPRRYAWTHSSVGADRKWLRRGPLLLAAPTIKAKVLIEVISATRGSIAVSRAGRVRPLRLIGSEVPWAWNSSPYFGSGGHTSRGDWVEVRVSKSQIIVEAVPGPTIEVANIKDIAAAIGKVREVRGMDARGPVDVLVDPDVNSQRLVDILVALEAEGVRNIMLGVIPNPRELALRGNRIPNTSVSGYESHGWDIWRVVRENTEKNDCYAEALAGDPDLSGVVTVEFFIESDGKVTWAKASGVDWALADCVARVFRTLAFGKEYQGTTQPPKRGMHEIELTFAP